MIDPTKPQLEDYSESEGVRRALSQEKGVAIIGMACLYPKAPDVDAFWSNILAKVDAVSDPPPESWDPEVNFDPNSTDSDKVYCKRGGYLGDLIRFDPLAYGIPPITVGGEPDQWLALKIARDALTDAGYSELEPSVRHRTAVILGRGALFNGGTAIPVQHGLILNQTLDIIKSLKPELTSEQMDELRRGLMSSLPALVPEIAPALTPNVIVGRIANRLDLMGPSFTVDAACASSLVAMHLAVRELLNGDCDLALSGGSHVWTPVPLISVFCQLGALSRRQEIRPFDKDADGTILGEGLGMLVLKRLSEAERDGDRIYAVIRGVGISSDGRAVGIMAPRVEGEELAMRRAYKVAEVSPHSVELIEAHGTGTSVGDQVEIEALRRVFGPRQGELPKIGIGSVKSMISHTVPAAGVASMIKTSLALYHKVLPPTLHCDEPNPRFELDKTPFYVNTESRPWIHGQDEVRRAAVSAFGFGGVNAHVVLEEHRPQSNVGSVAAEMRKKRGLATHRPAWDSEVCIFEAASRPQLLDKIRMVQRFVEDLLTHDSPNVHTRLEDLAYTLSRGVGKASEPTERLAVVAASLADLSDKLKRGERQLADPDCQLILERAGAYYTAAPLAREGKLAFLFPGEGSQYANMLGDLCLHFPEVRECFDRADRFYLNHDRDHVPSDYIFPRPSFSSDEADWADRQLWAMDGAVASVLIANEALLTLLDGLGLRPDALMGHSAGEWAALRAAGVYGASLEEKRAFIARELLEVYEDTISKNDIPPAALLAIGAGRDEISQIVAEAGVEAFVAMDNCPHQVVLVVEVSGVDAVRKAASHRGLMAERLSFDRPYHTPLFAPYSERLLTVLQPLDLLQPMVPLYSCATSSKFPSDATGIRQLMADQWREPVEFRRTIEAMYEDGVRIFVEVGPRGNLTSFVEDVLRGKRFSAVAANLQRRSGITQVNHLVGLLSAQGVELDLDYLFRWRNPRELDWEEDAKANESAQAEPASLQKFFPTMRVPEDLARRLNEMAPSFGAQLEGTPGNLTQPLSANTASENGRTLAPPAQHDTAGAIEAESHPIRPGSFGGVEDDNTRSHPPTEDVATHTFLDTMEQFLDVEHRVMRAYLHGHNNSPNTEEPPATHRQPFTNGSFENQIPRWYHPPEVSPTAQSVGLDRSIRENEDLTSTMRRETGSLSLAPNDERQRDPIFIRAKPSSEPASEHSDLTLDLAQTLLGIVSERTGYPTEVIDIEADLEADLGIDSIKRVEILGTLRQRGVVPGGFDLDQLTGLRTLKEVIALLREPVGSE